MIRKLFWLPAVLAVAVVMNTATISDAGAAERMFLRYSQWLPAAWWGQSKMLYPWFKQVEKATDGRVTIQPTAKGLGAPPRQNQLIVDGIADVAWVVHGYTPGVFPLSEMVELPFITRSAEANAAAYWKVFNKVFKPAGMHKDSHVLTTFLHVPGNIYNSKREVAKLADFRGLKIRIPNSVTSDALKLLDAVPIAAPVTKLRDGLAKKVFDGTAFTSEAVEAFKISKFIKHATIIPGGIYNVSFAITMNSAKWNKISAKDKATIMNLAGANLGARGFGRHWDKRDAEAPAKLKADGVTYNTLSGDALAGLKAKLAVFEQRWIVKAKAAGVDGPATLKMFRAEVAAYKLP